LPWSDPRQSAAPPQPVDKYVDTEGLSSRPAVSPYDPAVDAMVAR